MPWEILGCLSLFLSESQLQWHSLPLRSLPSYTKKNQIISPSTLNASRQKSPIIGVTLPFSSKPLIFDIVSKMHGSVGAVLFFLPPSRALPQRRCTCITIPATVIIFLVHCSWAYFFLMKGEWCNDIALYALYTLMRRWIDHQVIIGKRNLNSRGYRR